MEGNFTYEGLPPEILPPETPLPSSIMAPSFMPASGGASSLMMGSAGMSAISSIAGAFEQSAAIKARGEYQSIIGGINAKIANLKSREVLEQGDIAASRQNLKTDATVGAERAIQGASGTDVATGSNALVRTATQGAGAMDELTIRNNAQRQAFGYQTEAISDTAAGQMAKFEASAQSKQTFLTGGLSAISEPMQMYSKYLYYQRWLGGTAGGGSGVPFPNAS
jgi:hypothetical protein